MPTIDTLLINQTSPVSLPPTRTTGIDPRYERDWGWTPGTSHSVVLFRFLPDARIEVGDPAVGREEWSTESLDTLWGGQALRLVPR